MTFKLIDATIGQHVVMIEPINNEIRWWHYIRQEGVGRFSANVPVTSLRTVQGMAGKKPRFDSGENPTPSEMPAGTLVVDSSEVNHDWTEAYNGLMIIKSLGWIGIYINSKLIHRISPFENARRDDEITLVETVIKALDTDISIGRARCEWKLGNVLLEDLTNMKLEPI